MRARVWVHVALVLIALIWLVPVVALLISSFRRPQEVLQSGWWEAFSPPYAFTIRNYIEVIGSDGLGQAFLNSLTITIPVTLLTTLVGAVAGYAFARWRFRGREVVFAVILVLLSVPLQLTLVPVLRVFTELGIVGSFEAIWVAHVGYSLPFAVYLMRSFFAGLPDSLFDAAAVDGASELRTFLSLGLPLAVPALAAVAVFVFMNVWNDLLVALIYLGGGRDVAPLTVVVGGLVNSRGEGWQTLTAAAFILMIVPMVVFFALQRYFVRGLLAGAVK
ncbi:carbohydrate ABC transporter permease [Agromyces bauzanensis]